MPTPEHARRVVLHGLCELLQVAPFRLRHDAEQLQHVHSMQPVPGAPDRVAAWRALAEQMQRGEARLLRCDVLHRAPGGCRQCVPASAKVPSG